MTMGKILPGISVGPVLTSCQARPTKEKDMASENHILSRVRRGSQAESLVGILSKRQSSTSGKSISTIGALASAGMSLVNTCASCGFEETLRPSDILDRYSEQSALGDIEDVCPVCAGISFSRIPKM